MAKPNGNVVLSVLESAKEKATIPNFQKTIKKPTCTSNSIYKKATGSQLPHSQEKFAPLEEGEIASQGKGTGKPSYASVLSQKENDVQKELYYQQPKTETAPVGVHNELQEEDYIVIPDKWKNALVGFFIGTKPNYWVVKDALTKSLKIQ